MKLYEVNSPVNFDQRYGLAQVPWNQEVDYRGLRVYMKCSNFMRLIGNQAKYEFDPTGLGTEFIRKHIRDKKAIGSPFLDIDLPGGWFKDNPDMEKAAQVGGFEGRKRVTAVLEEYGDKYIEVHLLFRGEVRRRHITPAMIKDMMFRMIPLREKQPLQNTNRWFLFKG